jgi:hypothetical protein
VKLLTFGGVMLPWVFFIIIIIIIIIIIPCWIFIRICTFEAKSLVEMFGFFKNFISIK